MRRPAGPGGTGRGARRTLLVLAAGWAVIPWAAGCAAGGSSELRRHFEAGRLAEAEAAFRRDTSLRRDAPSVYRAALVYALPESPKHDPGRGRMLLRSYLDMRPEGERADEARRLLSLLEEIRRLRNRVGGLEEQLERLKEIDLERPPPDSSRRRRPGRR